ncbi:tetratricopeptide repeat protein [Streptosporangium vulgare]|uniref:tetratricopeptide repeat protein n=1 Tax=Streptosporangium vulgare TaxID=46190 RepID=UPI0031DDB206
MKTSAKARTAAAVLGLAAALTLGAALIPGDRPAPAPATAAVAPARVELAGTPASAVSLDGAIRALTERLRRLPADHLAWARLGAAYVQQARVTADPSSYPRAEEALARASALSPGDPEVLGGLAALAAGRHDFAEAVRLARSSVAANPYGLDAHAVLADAYTQLGRYGEARRAVDRMMELRPGVAAFTRASYDAELRGDRATARRMLETRALRRLLPPPTSPTAVTTWANWPCTPVTRAAPRSSTGSRWRPTPVSSPPSREEPGPPRSTGAPPRRSTATPPWSRGCPSPSTWSSTPRCSPPRAGDPSEQWTLLRAQRDLMREAGVRDDLTWAEYEADHGSPALAVTHARAEYARNPTWSPPTPWPGPCTATAAAARPLPYARKATATGWRNALLLHHRAEIERALGMTAEAGRSTRPRPRGQPLLLSRPARPREVVMKLTVVHEPTTAREPVKPPKSLELPRSVKPSRVGEAVRSPRGCRVRCSARPSRSRCCVAAVAVGTVGAVGTLTVLATPAAAATTATGPATTTAASTASTTRTRPRPGTATATTTRTATATGARVAHPLGNFTVNHYNGLRIGRDLVENLAVVDSAELPTLQARPSVDTDHSGTVSDSERSAYGTVRCAELASAQRLTVNGPRPPGASPRAPSPTSPARAGWRPPRLTCRLSAVAAPLQGAGTIGTGTISFRRRVSRRPDRLAGDHGRGVGRDAAGAGRPCPGRAPAGNCGPTRTACWPARSTSAPPSWAVAPGTGSVASRSRSYPTGRSPTRWPRWTVPSSA